MPDMSAQLLLVSKLFLLMGLGILLRRKNVIPESGKALLTDLVIDLILPCSILSSFLVDLTAERLRQTAMIFGLSVGVQLVSYGLYNQNNTPIHKIADVFHQKL